MAVPLPSIVDGLAVTGIESPLPLVARALAETVVMSPSSSATSTTTR